MENSSNGEFRSERYHNSMEINDISYVLDLIYWRDVRKTGVVFGSMIFMLLSLAFFSVLSVVAYLSLALLTVTLSLRVYKNIMGAVQKSNEGHPFKLYFKMDLDTKEVRRLFLIEDLFDSIQFGILLGFLTYIGSWFNGMTLIILAIVAVFTLPKSFETYKSSRKSTISEEKSFRVKLQ